MGRRSHPTVKPGPTIEPVVGWLVGIIAVIGIVALVATVVKEWHPWQ